MFGSFGSQSSTWVQPAAPAAGAPPSGGNRGSIGGGRASIGGAKDYDLVRALGEGSLPTTVKHLITNKATLTPTDMTIDGVSVANVRLVGMVVKGSIESTNGEFLFSFTDGTATVSFGDDGGAVEKCPLVLYSVSEEEQGGVAGILEKATPRGGTVLEKIVITGQVGSVNGHLSIRATHVRSADPCESTFFHWMECLHATVVPEAPATVVPEAGAGPAPASPEADLSGVTAEELLATAIPAAYRTVCVDMDNPLEMKIATAIQFMAVQKYGADEGNSEKFVKIVQLLDLLEKTHGGDRALYENKIKDKLANFEWYASNDEVEDDVYFLNE